MLRALLIATLLFARSSSASGQALSVLHITAVVVDAEGTTTPVARHALLISDDPPTTAPRRIFTGLDGTVNVRLRPGHYQVESDQPVVFDGKAYQWAQRIDVVAGRDATIALTARNAEIETAPATTAAAAPLETDPSFLQHQWQDSVVAIWTPTTHASGFVIDTQGLIVTNQRVIGTATSVEVQLSPEVKVAARVLVADAMRDVAVLWIDPSVVAWLKPVPLGCAPPAISLVKDDEELFTIGAPLHGQKRMTTGTIARVDPHTLVADLRLSSGSAGGPVFAASGALVGITSIADRANESGMAARVVRVDAAACEVIASARKKMTGAAAPHATRRPVDPSTPFPADALKEAAGRRAGNLSPYQMPAADFDVAFITPVHVYASQHRTEQQGGAGSPVPRALMDYGNWSEYVTDVPPVLMVRVTPKMVERFWTTVGRAAARTQGLELPPITHIKTGFARMRAFCGEAEVIPIHPFTIEQRISETDAIDEGFYVFDARALGPQCSAVRLVLYSEKEPEKADTRVVDARVLDQIWKDFAPYRE